MKAYALRAFRTRMGRDLKLCILVFTISAGGCALPQNLKFPRSQTASTPAELDRLANYARLHERQGKTDVATKIYEQVLRTAPEHPMARHRLGVLAAQEGDLDSSLVHLLVAAKQDKPTAELLTDLGYAYYLKQDYLEAEKTLQRAVLLAPGDKRARTNLGLVLGETGRNEEAFAQFLQSGTEAEARANLAVVLANQGKIEEATQNCHLALELDPSLRSVAEALVQLAQHTGNAEVKPQPSKLPYRLSNEQIARDDATHQETLSNIVPDAFLINAKQDAVVQQVGYVSSASDTGIAP